MRLRGLAAAASAAVLALVLAGCGDDEPATGTVGGGDDPPATTEPEETEEPAKPTEDPEDSEEPEAADAEEKTDFGDVDAETEAEAIAFVERYLDEQNQATLDGDFSTVDTMIEESCSVCTQSRDATLQVHADGNRVEGGVFENAKTSLFGEDDGLIVVTVETDVADAKIVDASGEVLDEIPGSQDRTFVYRLDQVNGDWKIVEGSAQ